MKCPACRTDNPSDSKFCKECSTPLSARKDNPVSLTETVHQPVKELATGTTFSGRYQVIEELGQGGMGKVYKVFDTKIKEKVALKLIKPELALDADVLERFNQEMKLARKIGHRNVCRMFDLGEADGVHFLTMEYVSGEDLKSMIRMSGTLSLGAILSIGKQAADGLAEAHNLGIVHRDLKPQNIMIDKGGNVKIMDFGIARSVREKGVTGPGVMIGTPEYMSPEQVEAKDVDHRSDIYSLGIILYEMATGRVPFEGETALAIAMRQKSEAPKNPKLLNPQIPDDLAGVILKCLEKDRSRRYQTAFDVRTELDRIEKGLPTTERVAPGQKPSTSKEITVSFRLQKLLIPAAAIIAVIAAAIVFWPRKTSDLDAKLVAVAVFENQTGDPKLDPIGRLAAESITQGLSQTGLFSVAPLPPAETLSTGGKNDLRLLAEATKAGKIVSGAYYLQGESIRFHSKIMDMADNKILLDLEPVSGPVQAPAKALEVLSLKLMSGLAGVSDPFLRDFYSLIGEPPKYDTYREVLDGYRAYLRLEFPKAVASFLRSATLDPDFEFSLLMAAQSYNNQGQYAKAAELVAEVEKSKESLPIGVRYFLDWLQAFLDGDLENDHRISKQIVALVPTSLMWNSQKAYSAENINYPQEAVDLLGRINLVDERWGGWRNQWWVLTTAYHMLGNHKQELKVARRGRKVYPELLSLLMIETRAVAALGRVKDLQKLIEESKTLPPQRGYSPGSIMLDSGRELRAHGHKEAVVQILNQAVQWFESRPQEEKATVTHRYNRAKTLYALEKWDEAKTLFEGLHNEWPDEVDYFGYLGSIAARKGNREEALKISQELKDNKTPYLFGNPAYWRARIAALLGDKEGSVNLLREAIKQGYSYSRIYFNLQDFESLADFPPYQQLMKPKG